MTSSRTAESFEGFLAELARTPDAPVCASQLPSGLQTASVITDRFRMERLVGSGGSAEVFLATDVLLGRPVAVKIARDGLDDRAQGRWLREAEALARLEHPNIVQVYRVGSHCGRSFIVMEWVEGETLAAWLGARPRDWPAILALFRDAGRGLAAAHAVGLVHRDFKPQNVLVGADGRVRVADFGLAALAAGHTLSEDERGEAGPQWNDRLTRGALGTLGYMPPEQFDGAAADPRSDQFSFCAALFEALVGRVPYEATTLEGARDRAMTGALEVATELDVPGWVMAALRRGLRPELHDRFADMDALLSALDPDRHRPRTRWIVGGGIAVAAVVGVVGLGSVRSAPCLTSIDAAWSPSRAEAVASAFERTGARDAAETSAAVVRTLDAWASQWGERRQAVCGELPGEERDARVACLERSRAAAMGVLDVLLEADAAVVSAARTIVGQLEAPSVCDRSSSADAIPIGSDRVAEVDEARRSIARSNADRLAGRLEDARAAADEALARAQASGFGPVIAEALLARGRSEAALDLPGGGLADLEAAYWAADGDRQDALAAEAARAVLANVAAGDPQAHDAVERWSRLAEAAEQRVGASPSWALLRARGSAASLTQRYDDARALYEAALEAMPDDVVLERASVLNSLSVLEFDAGRFERSHEHADRAASLAEANLPADHLARATALERSALAQAELGHAADAIEPMREAIGVKQRLFGTDNPRAIVSLNSLGSVLRRAGDLEAALEVHRQALEVSLQRVPRDPFEEGSCRSFIGKALVDLRRFEEARTELQASLQAYEDAEDPLNQGLTLISLASAQANLGDLDQALESLDAALEILEALTPQSSQVAGALANRAMIQTMQSRPEDALKDLARARPIAETIEHAGLIEFIATVEAQVAP